MDDPSVIKLDVHALLEHSPHRSAWNSKLISLLYIEFTGSVLLFHDKTHTRFGMQKRNCFYGVLISFKDDSRFCLNKLDLIVDVHVQKTSVGIDVVSEFLRSVDVKRLCPVNL